MKNMTLEEKIGQLFLGGFPGTKITEEFLTLIKKRKLGNVILFSHNIESKSQVYQLNRELKKIIEDNTGITPFIALDEEGGQVSRLPSDCAVVPSAMAQSNYNDMEKIKEGARIVVKECKALGFNFNLSPVLDINSNKLSPGIGTRSYGKTSERVSEVAGVILKQYLKDNFLCCGKHFPGDGEATKDTHLDQSVMAVDMDTLWERELVPFKNMIEQGLPSIMVGHCIVPVIDDKPCTVSKKAITGLLREKLKFNGIIVTDCLEMNAIKDYYGIENGTVAALIAGADLICISHTPAYIENSIQKIYEALEKGWLTEERIDSAVERILKAKSRFYMTGEEDINNVVSDEEYKYVNDFFINTIERHPGVNPFIIGENPLFIGIENVHLTAIYNSEKIDFAKSLHSKFGGTEITLGLKPTDEDLRTIKDNFDGKTSLVLGTFNGHLSEGQKKLIELCMEFNGLVCHVALRNPYDLEYSDPKWTRIALYEYTERSLRALTDMFR